MSDPATLATYYARPAVRARIAEYCGATAGSRPSCVYLSATAPGTPPPAGWTLWPRFPTGDLDDLLHRGADVYRSMWDRTHLLMHLDVDYLNAERLGHAYARPAEVFQMLEPTYQAVGDLLNGHGIHALALMTGRGYQFTGRIPLESALIDRLSALAPGPPEWFDTHACRLPSWIHDRMTARQARASVGAGMVMEYVAHQVICLASPRTRIPIVLNGTNVGWGPAQRQAVSLDVSFAGDPLDLRHMRVAFGGYQVHRCRPDVYGPLVSSLGPLVVLPRGETPLGEMLLARGTPDRAADLAESGSANIPSVTEGAAGLIAAYLQSPLARFHESFYAVAPDPPAVRHHVRDRLDLNTLPSCVAAPLAAPNDLLLKPEHLQHVTRFFMSLGWSPRDIASLVWSSYETDCGWGDRWAYLSARGRAEFDVRVFAGMVATALDEGIDFNCQSAQEKGLCPKTGCPYDLRVARDRLLAPRVALT